MKPSRRRDHRFTGTAHQTDAWGLIEARSVTSRLSGRANAASIRLGASIGDSLSPHFASQAIMQTTMEMAIGGLGDLGIGRELTPALTTISVSAYEIGRRAGEIVLGRLGGSPEQPCVVDLGFSILARDST